MPVPQVTLLSDAFTGADGTALATYDAHYVTSLLGTTKSAQLLTNRARLAGSDGSLADVFRIYRDDLYVYDLDATWAWTYAGGDNDIYTKMMARGPSAWGTTNPDGPASGTAALSVNAHPGVSQLAVTLHHNNDTFTDVAVIPVTFTNGDTYGWRWRLTGGLFLLNLWDITTGGTLATSTPYAIYDPSGETINQYGRFAWGTTFGSAALSRTLDLDDLVVKTNAYSHAYPIRDRGSDVSVSAGFSTVITLSAPTTIAIGSYLFAYVAVDNTGFGGNGPGLAITDSRGTTWTVSTRFNKSSGGVTFDGTTGYFCYAKVTTAYQAADTVTFTWTTSVTAKAIFITEWGNVHPTSPISLIVEANGTGTAVSNGTITPTAAGQVVIAMVAIEGPGAETYTPTASTTDGAWGLLGHIGGADATATNNQSVGVEFKVIDPTSGWAAQTFAPTLGTSRDWVAHMQLINPDDTQIVIPDGDTVATGWTTAAGASSPLYAQIDEVPANDLDYVKATLA